MDRELHHAANAVCVHARADSRVTVAVVYSDGYQAGYVTFDAPVDVVTLVSQEEFKARYLTPAVAVMFERLRPVTP